MSAETTLGDYAVWWRERIGELLRGARVWPGVTIPDGGIRYSTDV